MRKILIATPAYNGQIATQTMIGINLARDEGRDCGWEVRALPFHGSADIADTRNRIVGLFLKTECDDLLFVDADIAFGPGTFKHIMAHDVDVVGGLYRQRTDYRVNYAVEWLETQNMVVSETTGFPLLEAKCVPSGFLRIRRSCLDLMSEHPDTRWIKDEPTICGGTEYPFLFEWSWNKEDGGPWTRRSEDFTFCHRWRAMGGKVWVDPALKLDHIGQKIYQGDFMAVLQKQMLESSLAGRLEAAKVA